MELNCETTTLSFSKGMTNKPSDLLSEDSELSFCEDFIYRSGEMKPIQRMANIGSIGGKIMHVHKMADFENIVTYDEFADGGTLSIYKKGKYDEAAFTYTNIGAVYDVNSVGNTLVAATDSGLRYFLHKGDKYKDLGVDMPEPHFKPWFDIWNAILPKNTYDDIMPFLKDKGNVSYTLNDDGTISVENGGNKSYHLFELPTDTEKYDNAQSRIKGSVSKATNIVKENNYFPHPFFIRFAWKLFDGSYAKISNPIICYPTARRNGNFVESSPSTYQPLKYIIRFQPCYGELYFQASNNHIGEWGDIIKELVVFASDDVAPYNIDEDWKIERPENLNGQRRYDGVSNGKYLDVAYKFTSDDASLSNNGLDSLVAQILFVPKKYKTDDEIIDELMKKTQYYRLFSLKADSLQMKGATVKASTVMKSHTVENLTSQEQLPVDDYYGWTQKVGKKIYPYNNRLNLLRVDRYPFRGFNLFTADSCTNGEDFVFYTHIVSDSMDAWVKSDSNTMLEATLPGWLYYPDPNATEMVIMKASGDEGSSCVKVKLTPHPSLNGAYSFSSMPVYNHVVSGSETEPSVDATAHETLDSQIFTSVANNPFIFESKGDNTIGTGKILGIVANTEAVSQGQFGQYPLLVFTDEGIYAMSVNAEGLYSSIHPISREVCNNAASITPTDKVIFFTSEKGLMATSGGAAVCVSEQLSGGKNRGLPESFLPFRKFINNCMIAYDYKASLLRIFNKSTNYHYVYNMVDKNFAIAQNYAGGKIFCRNVANNYPDSLVQFTDSMVYSLTGIPLEEDDENTYGGLFTTRPLKLGGSKILKSLRAVKHLADTYDGVVSLEVYGSNDCKHWCKLESLKGKPWAYFKFKYNLSDFKASDTFTGSLVRVQNRRSLMNDMEF